MPINPLDLYIACTVVLLPLCAILLVTFIKRNRRLRFEVDVYKGAYDRALNEVRKIEEKADAVILGHLSGQVISILQHYGGSLDAISKRHPAGGKDIVNYTVVFKTEKQITLKSDRWKGWRQRFWGVAYVPSWDIPEDCPPGMKLRNALSGEHRGIVLLSGEPDSPEFFGRGLKEDIIVLLEFLMKELKIETP